jgi:hypothetical protein
MYLHGFNKLTGRSICVRPCKKALLHFLFVGFVLFPLVVVLHFSLLLLVRHNFFTDTSRCCCIALNTDLGEIPMSSCNDLTCILETQEIRFTRQDHLKS